jgi:hypothetical protein
MNKLNSYNTDTLHEPIELLLDNHHEDHLSCCIDFDINQEDDVDQYLEVPTFYTSTEAPDQNLSTSDVDQRLDETCEKYNPAKNKSGKRAWEITKLLRLFTTTKATPAGQKRSTSNGLVYVKSKAGSTATIKTKKKANFQNTILRDVFRRIKVSKK